MDSSVIFGDELRLVISLAVNTVQMVEQNPAPFVIAAISVCLTISYQHYKAWNERRRTDQVADLYWDARCDKVAQFVRKINFIEDTVSVDRQLDRIKALAKPSVLRSPLPGKAAYVIYRSVALEILNEQRSAMDKRRSPKSHERAPGPRFQMLPPGSSMDSLRRVTAELTTQDYYDFMVFYWVSMGDDPVTFALWSKT